MKRFIITTFAVSIAAVGIASAQSHTTESVFREMESVLREIESNNTKLEALRHSAEAEKLENRTGISLDDPEIGFNYLWGGPASIGNRQDVSVTQGFDFGTITGLKNKVANERNELIEWQYKTERMSLLLEAKNCCIDLIYWNAVEDVLDTRLRNAEIVAEEMRKKLEQGEGNRIEYNNARLDLASVQNAHFKAHAEQSALLTELSRLNGGKRIDFTLAQFPDENFPEDFNLWYSEAESSSPVLAYVRQEIEVNRKELSLRKTSNLPSLTLGYMGEFTQGERYQGISFGISVPLWSNARKIRQAKAAVQAAQSREIDAKQQFYSKLEQQYTRAAALRAVAENSREYLEDSDNSSLLKKAVEEGEISVPEYLISLWIYYDAVNRYLEAEREYQKAFAELSSYRL